MLATSYWASRSAERNRMDSMPSYLERYFAGELNAV